MYSNGRRKIWQDERSFCQGNFQCKCIVRIHKEWGRKIQRTNSALYNLQRVHINKNKTGHSLLFIPSKVTLYMYMINKLATCVFPLINLGFTFLNEIWKLIILNDLILFQKYLDLLCSPGKFIEFLC